MMIHDLLFAGNRCETIARLQFGPRLFDYVGTPGVLHQGKFVLARCTLTITSTRTIEYYRVLLEYRAGFRLRGFRRLDGR